MVSKILLQFPIVTGSSNYVPVIFCVFASKKVIDLKRIFQSYYKCQIFLTIGNHMVLDNRYGRHGKCTNIGYHNTGICFVQCRPTFTDPSHSCWLRLMLSHTKYSANYVTTCHYVRPFATNSIHPN